MISRPRTGVVIVAAGNAERMAGVEKMLAPLDGLPLLLHSVRAFEASDAIDEIVVVTRADLSAPVHSLVEREGVAKLRAVVQGGASRSESSMHGLGALSHDVEIVLVHDGARPLVSTELIGHVAAAAVEHGAALPAMTPVTTIRHAKDGMAAGTLDRSKLREAQTPQGFRRGVLAKAFAAARKDDFEPTDEAASVERLGEPVVLLDGERRNFKVTVPEDLAVAEALIRGSAPPVQTRVGLGHDVHALVEGRALILGGVEIEHDRGLVGHSDADVLSHAICDALLGAGGQGDIGDHFPDSSDEWKNVSGAELLARTVEILREVGYVPVNVDATVNAEAPRLAPHRERMIGNLARAMRLSRSQVSVKFTTTERLGFVGREEGISATAIVLVGKIPLMSESA